jgi:hypothetical protein
MLDHLRAQFCLNRVGKHVRTLIYKPISNFYNLYEFMNMISFYAEQPEHSRCTVKDVGAQISVLRYTFPCNMSSKNEPKLYGTGGKNFANALTPYVRHFVTHPICRRQTIGRVKTTNQQSTSVENARTRRPDARHRRSSSSTRPTMLLALFAHEATHPNQYKQITVSPSPCRCLSQPRSE